MSGERSASSDAGAQECGWVAAGVPGGSERRYLVLKKPSLIAFVEEEWEEEAAVAAGRQVRYSGARSNTAVVRLRDGRWALRNGREVTPLRSVEVAAGRLARVDAEGGEFVCDVTEKYFARVGNKLS